MKQSITRSGFINAFHAMDRGDQFSYGALCAMYEYLEENYSDMDLDVVGLCCEFTEYNSLEDLQADYSSIEDLDDLQNHTLVIELSAGGLLIQQF